MDIKLNDTIFFENKAPQILGIGFTGTVEFIGKFHKAKMFSDRDLATTNVQVFTALGIPDIPDVNTLTFIEIHNIQTGEVVYMAKEWIDETTFIKVSIHSEVTFKCFNITNEQVAHVREFFKLEGINEYSVGM